MPQGHLLRLDNSTSEKQKLTLDQAMDEDLAKILDENNLLQAGTLPAVHAATEAGEKALLAFYDEGAAMAKRAAKPRKDKEAPEDAKEMEPKTVRQLLGCFVELLQCRVLCCLCVCIYAKAGSRSEARDPQGCLESSRNLPHPEQPQLRGKAGRTAAEVFQADGACLQEAS